MCHYHDCLRGTIEKPDYRLVDDKLYFDFSMKYMYPENGKAKKEIENGDNIDENKEMVETGDVIVLEKKKKRKKTKAMVINHKIYF